MRTIRLSHAEERLLRCGAASGAVSHSAIAMKQAFACVVVLAGCAIAQQPALTIYNQRFAVVQVGTEPNSVALNLDGTRAYVANTVSGTERLPIGRPHNISQRRA